MVPTVQPTGSPSPSKSRPAALTWFIRILIVLAAVPIVLALLGTAYQAIATAAERRAYPAPGQLVDVGGYRLHLYCEGQGSPTVILDSANQGTVSNWAWIQPSLARITRVCAYDRVGEGWSDASPHPQDTRQNAEALHSLLANAGVAPPYVLVGHSFGGLYTRMFAETYPSEIAGMVFVEGTHPDGPGAGPARCHAERAAAGHDRRGAHRQPPGTLATDELSADRPGPARASAP